MGNTWGEAVATIPTTTMTLDDLYRRYRGPIQHYLLRLSGSPDQAEELAQETFIRACAGILTFRGDCSVATWLFRIARNTYLSSLRRGTTTRVATSEFLAIPDEHSSNDPSHRYDRAEQRDAIRIALLELPEKQRTILLLRDDEGLSYAEIADVLGISLSAVKINLFRARHAFRAIYASATQGDYA
jgi:RNA polymerase sigma-70 factor, ECF subfamily